MSGAEDAPRKRRSREEQIYDFFLEDARDILTRLEAGLAEAGQVAEVVSSSNKEIADSRAAIIEAGRYTQTALRETVAQVSAGRDDAARAIAAQGQKITARIGWVVFLAAVVGGLAGGVIATFLPRLVG